VALVIGVPCAGVGLVVARRQPANPLGWLFLVIAVCLFLSTVGGDYAVADYELGHHLPLGAAGLALDPLWTAALALFVVVILLFPDGSLPSRFWRWALRAFCLMYVVLLVALAVATSGALAARAEVMVAAFALRLKDAVELESVRDDLADVVQQALEPAHVWVWMSERG
jgi:hypothetical protein